MVGRMTDTDTEVTCHACNAPIEGEPAGHGLLLFVRGDENNPDKEQEMQAGESR